MCGNMTTKSNIVDSLVFYLMKIDEAVFGDIPRLDLWIG